MASDRRPVSVSVDAAVLPPRVRVYRNLHAFGPAGEPVYSVMDPRTRRVTARVVRIVLVDAVMRVSEHGRQRVIAERRKNVHAFIEGCPVDPLESWTPVGVLMYDPYRTATFVDRDSGAPVASASVVWVDGASVRYGQRDGA